MRPWRSSTSYARRAVVLCAVVLLLLPGAAGCATARVTGEPIAGVAASVGGNLSAWEPPGLAPTFTEKPFWIILALVVLGWIVLAADLPDQRGW
ncbi:MAG: hypothetical protein IT317_19675 [Anaerolineales bacterium]|nr:hypothetical protein [Anaerolineales bacterium]